MACAIELLNLSFQPAAYDIFVYLDIFPKFPGEPGVWLCADAGLIVMAASAWLVLYCLVRRVLVYRDEVVMISP